MKQFSIFILFALSTILPCQADENASVLASKITLEARRLPLPEFLQELQKQSGAQIQLAPDSPFAEKSVTATFKDMKLADVLRSLHRLYGIQWQQAAPSQWIGNTSEKADLEYQLLRLGDMDIYEKQSARSRWMQTKWFDKTGALNAANLSSATGVSLSQLEPQLQKMARADCQNVAGGRLISSFARAVPAALEEEWLHFSLPKPRAAQNIASAQSAPTAALQTFEGRILAPLGTLSAAKTPETRAATALETRIEK